MTSEYIAISFLKQSPLPEKQLRIFYLTYHKIHLKNIYTMQISIKEEEICQKMI